MPANKDSLVIIIPSRNRADLAINAVRSVVPQMKNLQIRLVVSDNSTDAEQSSRLEGFCRGLKHAQIDYLKPPEPLSMTRHYEWILQRSLKHLEAGYFSILTDRMVFRPEALAEVVALSVQNPGAVVTYNHDRVVDHIELIRLEQEVWSGEVRRIETRHLLELARKSRLHACFPRLMNCVVPREVLQRIAGRFGSICASSAPDFSFCFRALEILDDIVYYDKSVLLHYALNRSNGFSFSRGVRTKDARDFCENLSNGLNPHAPHPEFETINNAIMNEYCYVKNEAKSAKFGEVEMGPYLHLIAYEVTQMENEELRNRMRKLLKHHGYQEPRMRIRVDRKAVSGSPQKSTAPLVILLPVRRLLGHLRRYIQRVVREPKSINAWMLANKMLGVTPPEDNRFVFKSAEQAIAYAFRFPKQKASNDEHIAFLFNDSV